METTIHLIWTRNCKNTMKNCETILITITLHFGLSFSSPCKSLLLTVFQLVVSCEGRLVTKRLLAIVNRAHNGLSSADDNLTRPVSSDFSNLCIYFKIKFKQIVKGQHIWDKICRTGKKGSEW